MRHKSHEPILNSTTPLNGYAQAKVGEIDEKIRHLRAMKKALETLARSCADNREHRCPLLEALDDAQPRRTR
jgi:hypothetical protein